MPVFNIKHTTHYTYATPVRDSANQIILFPVKDEFQKVLKYELNISGNPSIELYHDYYGNEVGNFTQTEPHQELKIISRSKVETIKRPLPEDHFTTTDQWNLMASVGKEGEFIDFLKQEKFNKSADLKHTAEELRNSADTPYQTALRLCQYIYRQFEYIQGVTNVNSTLDEILKLEAGVCQDFAHLLTAMLRSVKIPARYVSGYICPNKNGMRGEGATHAWSEFFIPGYGWLGLDPTNNCIANENHVKLAVGRKFSDCSPVKGVYSGRAEQHLEVTVSVGYDEGDHTTDTEQHFVPKYNEPVFSSMDQPAKNSYQRHLEIMQQQQQQQ